MGVGEINLAEKMIRNHFKNWLIFGISNAEQMDEGIVLPEKKNFAVVFPLPHDDVKSFFASRQIAMLLRFNLRLP